MRTSKPIAFISYNTSDFLLSKLNELVSSSRISDFYFIHHLGEIDTDTGYKDKDHFHVWLCPNRLLDTTELSVFFKEVDILHPSNKPLGVVFSPCPISKLDDFIMYCLHDVRYLRLKGETKQYSYSQDDFVYYDYDTFIYNFNSALHGEWLKKYKLIDLVNQNYSAFDIYASGSVALAQYNNLKSVCRDRDFNNEQMYLKSMHEQGFYRVSELNVDLPTFDDLA